MSDELKFSSEIQELLDLLREGIEDSSFIELMDRARASSSPSTVIMEAYSELVGQGATFVSKEFIQTESEQVERIAKAGISIEPVYGKQIDPVKREEKEILLGYELSKIIGDRKLYSGMSGYWGARYSSLPYGSIEHARRAAVILLDVEAEQPNSVYPPVEFQYVKLYTAIGNEPAKIPAQLNLKMTLEETTKMDSLVRGMRAQNIEIEENKPINAYAHVVRYLLGQLKVR